MKKKKNSNSKSKPRWQQKKEKQAQKDSQYDPEIHYMSKVGIGFGLRKDYKEKPGEASGANLKDLFDKWSWTPKKKNEDTGSSQN